MLPNDFARPDSPLAHIVSEAMEELERKVEAAGGEMETLFVTVTVNGMEPDAAICGRGFDGPVELLSYLLMHAQQMGKRIGLTVTPIGLPDNN